MKKLLIIILISAPLLSWAQSLFYYPMKNLEPVKIMVTYSLNFIEDTLNPNFVRQENMLLFLGDKLSQFVSKNAYFTEQEMLKIETQEQLQHWLNNKHLSQYSSRFAYKIYKNYPAGFITTVDYVSPNPFKYQENISLINWKLISDTTTIMGYKSQKATANFGGRKWFAWFTSEIPYHDGPYKFNGLPGLIIRLHDQRNHYVFEVVSIEKLTVNQSIQFAERNYIETTKKFFFKAEDDFRDDIINRAKAAGLGNDAQQTAARNIARRNNPIELDRK